MDVSGLTDYVSDKYKDAATARVLIIRFANETVTGRMRTA